MTDRAPTKPGRIALTDEETNITKYYRMTMADDPTEVGTELNKANLLSDAAAADVWPISAPVNCLISDQFAA